MNNRVSIPQGTRDFPADIVRKRNYILTVIKRVFVIYGFEPLETPAFENLETLMGKYGDEGDKLIFKILNNGLSDPRNIEEAKKGFEKLLQGKNTTAITERALKYDLTIPLARYVAMNHTRLTFPFRRYQAQPVWRADRPQKGRYREFTQCDADVAGSRSLLNELELANIYHEVFTELKIHDYALRINHRKILVALAVLCGGAERMTDITVTIDKLDKIGLEKVLEELKERGFNAEQIKTIENFLRIAGTNEEKMQQANALLVKGSDSIAMEGIAEIEFLHQHTKHINVKIDFTLARGLNYYTGIIYEAQAPSGINFGSIGGGGRYDDLTGLFGVPDIPGVGISFGIDRIYDVLEEMDLFPGDLQISTKALFFNMGDKESLFSFDAMQQLRSKGIACEIYHQASKIDKQFKYAEKKKIPFVVIIGGNEMESGVCQVKNLTSGRQETIPVNGLAEFFNKQ